MVVPDARIYCGSVRREWKPQRHECGVGGIYTDDMVGICLAEGHKTTQNILPRKPLP